MRMNPGGDLVPKGLELDMLLTGWSGLPEALSAHTYRELRDMVHKRWYSSEPDYRRSGASASILWLFLFEMAEGDYVVVPHGPEFLIAEVAGPAFYDPVGVQDDSAHRRKALWLNGGQAFRRKDASVRLQMRMKTQGTTVEATDLMADIERILSGDRRLPFDVSLRESLTPTTRHHLIEHVTDHEFERLISSYLKASGAQESRVVARTNDKGVDVRATFFLAGMVPVRVGVQAKHWEHAADLSGIQQLLSGLAEEGIDVGIFITTAGIPDSVRDEASLLADRQGVSIYCIDGTEFARNLLDLGLAPLASRSGVTDK
jgi:predicted Mrr-cat superfamily restriction endonuclease